MSCSRRRTPITGVTRIARRMRQLADRQLAADTPEARHAWVEWLGDRDAQALLRSLIQAIDAGDTLDGLQATVDGWRANALKTLAANDYRAAHETSPGT